MLSTLFTVAKFTSVLPKLQQQSDADTTDTTTDMTDTTVIIKG